MSRSVRHTPIAGVTTASSESWSKAASSRAYRRAVNMAVRANEDAPDQRSIRDPWTWPKDGKSWFGHERPKMMRK